MPQSTISNNEVRAAIHSLPPWITRWGNSIIILLLAGMLGFCCFVKFNDHISVPVRVESFPKIKYLALAEDGYIELKKPDHSIVSEGDTLLVSRNPHRPDRIYKAPFRGQVLYSIRLQDSALHYQDENIILITPLDRRFIFYISGDERLVARVRNSHNFLFHFEDNSDMQLEGRVARVTHAPQKDTALLILSFKTNADSLLSLHYMPGKNPQGSLEIEGSPTTLMKRFFLKTRIN
ncbi:MAG: hypothetical protein JWM28_380 [Chitinophagaceae bacterium]|nr:hypothetical protein [Chitinophagaceae bacterium]